MLVTLRKFITEWLLIAAGTSLLSCASEQKTVSVVNDPDAKKENAIPWNQQEKWEQGAEMGGLAQGTDRVEH